MIGGSGGVLSKEAVRVNVRSLSETVFCYDVTNASLGLANSLRRIMHAEVPTLAIDIISISNNTSVMHDEMLAHRIALVPIDSRAIDNFNFRHECQCSEKCPRCSVSYGLTIRCEGPENYTVTHLDLIPQNISNMMGEVPMPVPKRDQISGVSGPIPLTKLRPGQALAIELNAYKGIGKVHAKWSPVSVVHLNHEPPYGELPPLTTRSPLCVEHRRLCAAYIQPDPSAEGMHSRHGQNVFGAVEDVARHNRPNEIIPVDSSKCCVCLNEANPMLHCTIPKVGKTFYFKVESVGSLPAEQIALTACHVLERKINNILNAVVKAANTTQNTQLY